MFLGQRRVFVEHLRRGDACPFKQRRVSGQIGEAHYRNLISTGRLVESLRVGYAELAEVAALYGRTVGHGT